MDMISSQLGPIAGGALIGLGAVLMMLISGKIAGVSGIFSGLLQPKVGDTAWRLAFVAGIIAGGGVLALLHPEAFAADGSVIRSLPVIALGGLLVGFGARLGSGCTSGHGVCGIARLGPRSFVATIAFIASGAGVTYLVNQVLGGAV